MARDGCARRRARPAAAPAAGRLRSARLVALGDGTTRYYFALDEVAALLRGAGFVVLDAKYACVRARNRRTGAEWRRVFVHARATRPLA